MLRLRIVVSIAAAVALLPTVSQAGLYGVQNLVSDGAVPAAHIDPQLVNAWGVSFPPNGPFWVSDNGSGFTTLYNGQGVKQGLIVQMPGNSAANPIPITGQVFNGTSSFNGDLFLFAGENGAIYGWRGALGTTAETLKLPSDPNTGDVYKGLALSGTNLIAANFRTGNLDVFKGSIGSLSSFSDSTLPAGFAPFNVQNLNGKIYVTFALQDSAKHDDMAGVGNGFVDVFDPTTGKFTRLISNGPLNSPWGLALAPPSFGDFGNDLLVGNFGDGMINAFDPNTGALVGPLLGLNGQPLSIDGLWALTFGSGSATAPKSQLFFTAGPNGESDGVFGTIVLQAPEPSSAALFAVAGAGALLLRRWRRRTT
jgi:uncharacterized protein (TIGR03118 family)